MIVEILGWTSTGLTIASFIPKGESRIRLVNSVACIGWIAYSVLSPSYPLIVVNSVVLGLHIKYFIQNRSVKIDHTYIEPDKRNEILDPDYMYKWIKRNSGK
jgi:hypothetical protein